MVTTPTASVGSSVGIQNKKYLRTAPRPGDWEELTANVLRGLGSDPDRAEQVVRTTLDRIQNEHHWQPKSGPGRKSNAEHALHFYEHLLEQIIVQKQQQQQHQSPRRGTDTQTPMKQSPTRNDKIDQEEEDEEENDQEEDDNDDADEDEDEDDSDDEEQQSIDNRDTQQEQEPTNMQDESDDDGEEEEERIKGMESTSPAVATADSPENQSAQRGQRGTGHSHIVCDVCKEPGEEGTDGRLMVCVSCGLAFHLECVRPVATEFPPPEWRCAYCVLATEPKNTKNRRVSAAAVRLMARLRNGLKRRKVQEKSRFPPTPLTTFSEPLDHDDEGEEDDEDRGGGSSADRDNYDDGEDEDGAECDDDQEKTSQTKPEEEGTEVGNAVMDNKKKQANRDASKSQSTRALIKKETDEDTAEGNNTKNPTNPSLVETTAAASRKRKLALYKLADAFTGQVPPGDDDVGRGKRSRKQPTLFDPQMSVPARSWQSDEIEARDTESDSDDDNKEAEEEISENASQNTRHGRELTGGDVYCSFCNDDPMVKLCCFCGCRRCFGKHKKSKLLICDECDDEYHTFCLNPPLTSLPTRNWFCPNCEKSRKKGTAVPTNLEKSPRREAASTHSQKSAKTTAARSAAPGAPQPPRRRGRPPKNPDAVQQKKPSGRKRGRPPKHASPIVVSPPRKRGRPPNRPQVDTSNLNKLKPLRAADGRFISPKSDSKNDKKSFAEPSPRSSSYKSKSRFVDQDFVYQMPAPVKVSRSGRTVKRTSFHDEIEEGEQHLRSERTHAEYRTPHLHNMLSSTLKARAQQIITSSVSPSQATPESVGVASAILKAPPKSSETKAATAVATPLDSTPADEVSTAEQKGALLVNHPGTLGSLTQAESTEKAADMPKQAVAFSGGSLSEQLPASTGARLSISVPMGGTAVAAAAGDAGIDQAKEIKTPRRKPGARECVQISRRFGVRIIPEKYSEILLDYCSRGKVEHLIRMRERLDEHSRFLELQLAGLEQLVKEKGELNIVVPILPEGPDRKLERTLAGEPAEH